jgi:hypothetical protein
MSQGLSFIKVKGDGTFETKTGISHQQLLDYMEAELASEEEKHGILPLITEFCENPDTENEKNWERMPTPTEEEKNNYGSFCPPIYGYKRTPPNLLEYGPEKMIGRTITMFHTCVGTYGMGGSGWVGFDLDKEGPPLMLVYCVWGAREWIKFTPHTPRERTALSWKIQSFELTDQMLEIRAIDQETLTEVVIRTDDTPNCPCNVNWNWVAKRGHGRNPTLYKMGELWHACRPDGEHWCS